MTKVLVVDDEPMLGDLVSRALGTPEFGVSVVRDVASAEQELLQADFDVIVCDINLDGESGTILIDHERVRTGRTAAVVMSGSADLPAAMDVIHRGAIDFIAKPFSPGELRHAIGEARARRDKVRDDRERRLELERLVRERTEDLSAAVLAAEEAYDRTIEALGAALDLRDTETERHCRNVAETSLRIASASGITNPHTLRDLRWGALLHDIGKIGIPDSILRKPGPLTAEERLVVNTHPELGARLIGGIDFLTGAATVVLHHHERYDGTGYPDGLAGEEISLLARIFAVADAVDVLASGRVYQGALSPEAVREEVRRSASTHFDPFVVERFLSLELSEQGVVA